MGQVPGSVPAILKKVDVMIVKRIIVVCSIICSLLPIIVWDKNSEHEKFRLDFVKCCKRAEGCLGCDVVFWNNSTQEVYIGDLAVGEYTIYVLDGDTWRRCPQGCDVYDNSSINRRIPVGPGQCTNVSFCVYASDTRTQWFAVLPVYLSGTGSTFMSIATGIVRHTEGACAIYPNNIFCGELAEEYENK